MRIKSLWLRRIHKWVGLAIGLQFVLWAVSGAAMALLDMETVAGGPRRDAAEATLPIGTTGWPRIAAQIGTHRIEALRSGTLLDRPVIEAATAQGTRLFDARTGARLTIDAATARAIAQDNHPAGQRPLAPVLLTEASLAVRDHRPPIWKVDFGDAAGTTYYVSATSGALLERRNDTWRWWDFFWMLHNMDYADRTSFNHPLIIAVGIAMTWLAVTGFWLLFRTMWRHDVRWLRPRKIR